MLHLLALILALTPAAFAAPPLFVEEVNTLMSVEEQGYGFAQQMGSKEATNLADLYAKNSGYKLIADSLAADLARLAASGKNTGPSMKYSFRTFDSGWLKSRKANFELAGITFRPDRRSLHPGLCGEVRLIYRLAYTDQQSRTYSRLPMTIQQVRTLPGPCPDVAAKWSDEKSTLLRFLGTSELYDLELNLQSVRWPAAVRPDMGGYAEYMMRAFEKGESGWQAKVLANTIDVERINRSPELKRQLLSWLKDPANVELVDQGDAVLAPKFLATKVSSVAVHGLNRKANRFFAQVFSEGDFAAVNFAKTKFIKSPQGYLRKLEELTCVGCHQSKSIAGFHFLGKDRPGGIAFNKVTIPSSYHFMTDQDRRQDVLALQQQALPVHSLLGFVDRPSEARGAKNDRCYVGKDKSFAHWTCRDSVCEPVGAAVGPEFFGVCQSADGAEAGEACYFGRITQALNPKNDREIQRHDKACKGQLGCLHPSDGYPGGLCFANFCDPTSSKACAALAVPGFNPCLARGRPFKECLGKFTGSIEAAECDLTRPCRDDFICAEGFAGKGVCAPPYSLFQLRVDGHPSPN